MIEIKKIAYSEADPKEIHRWLDHIVERLILDQLNTSTNNKLMLQISKHIVVQRKLEGAVNHEETLGYSE